MDYALLLLYYCFAGSLLVLGIVCDTPFKGSWDIFVELAGRPTWYRVFGVIVCWPLVVGYVLVKCWHLKRVNFKLRRQTYRMVEVQERRAYHFEVEKAVRWLRWRYWRPVVDLNGEPLRFNSHQELGAYINRLEQELLDQEFKVVRSPSKRFTRV